MLGFRVYGLHRVLGLRVWEDPSNELFGPEILNPSRLHAGFVGRRFHLPVLHILQYEEVEVLGFRYNNTRKAMF